MNIVRPYARAVERPLDLEGSEYSDLGFIESAARISHRSENDSHKSNTEKFIRDVVVGHGDWSVTEHISISVEFYVDRGITHELVRHRLFSYTQESTRFVNYEKKMPPSFIYPIIGVECERCLEGQNPEPISEKLNDLHVEKWRHYMSRNGNESTKMCCYEPTWLTAVRQAEDEYRNLLSIGWRPQEARSVFPNALASKILMTGNLRSWRHFFLMRTSKESHPQMRQVTIPLLDQFKSLIPVLYDDIIPDSRQIDNLQKGQ